MERRQGKNNRHPVKHNTANVLTVFTVCGIVAGACFTSLSKIEAILPQPVSDVVLYSGCIAVFILIMLLFYFLARQTAGLVLREWRKLIESEVQEVLKKDRK